MAAFSALHINVRSHLPPFCATNALDLYGCADDMCSAVNSLLPQTVLRGSTIDKDRCAGDETRPLLPLLDLYFQFKQRKRIGLRFSSSI